MVQQRCGRRKFGFARVQELERIGNIVADIGEFDRPPRPVACGCKILPVEGNTTPSPYRCCPSQHPSAVELGWHMARVVDSLGLEKAEEYQPI